MISRSKRPVHSSGLSELVFVVGVQSLRNTTGTAGAMDCDKSAVCAYAAKPGIASAIRAFLEENIDSLL